MRRTQIIISIGLMIALLGAFVTGCHNIHLEVPITAIKSLEDIAVEIEEGSDIDLYDDGIKEYEDLGTAEGYTQDNRGIELETSSFRVVNDIKVCRNITFDTTDKVSTLYLIDNTNVMETSMNTDMTQLQESAIKFRIKGEPLEIWAYINVNGIVRERPWETNIVKNEHLAVWPSRVEAIVNDNFSGNFTQVAVTETNEETGEGFVTVYNDTYASKKYGDTLISLHITKAQKYSAEEYIDEVIITTDDILKVFNSFQFAENAEIKEEIKQFRFSNPISFVETIEEESESPSFELKEGELTEEGVDIEPLKPEISATKENIVGVINSSDMVSFPFNVVDKVLDGGQILNTVEVPEKDGMKLMVQNTDIIYKGIKQCKILSLTYDFAEKEDYDIRIFDYLKANSKLEDIDTNVLSYDNYYINEEGTGYVVYNIDRWDIRTITTYYVMDRLSGLVVEFE